MTPNTWNAGKFHKCIPPFGRFLIVGVINTFLTAAVIFLLMNVFHKGYWISTFLGNAGGMISSFLLNRKFTFESHVSLGRGFAAFLLSACACYFLSYFSSEKILEIIDMYFYNNHLLHKQEISVLLGMFFYTGTNFIAQKHFVFGSRTY